MGSTGERAVLALAFLDLLGFGMLIPDIQLRAEAWGAPGWMIGGLLSSTFLIQFLVSPRWGHLSDAVGRKPVIVGCTVLSALSMAVYAMATNPGMILVSRILAGVGAANIAVAQAYVADSSDPGSKVAAMGRVGSAVSAGLIFGPALGGWLASIGGNHLLGAVAATASCAGAAIAAFALPRIQPKPRESQERASIRDLLPIPGLARTVFVIAVSWFALAMLEGTFGRLIESSLGYGQFEFGVIFAFESMVTFGAQAFLVDRLSKRRSTRANLRASYLLMGVGLVSFPWAPSFAFLLVGSFLFAVGSGVANPTANALCSSLTPDDRQGQLFGLLQSARSLGYLLGPSLGGALFDVWHAGPYVLAALICCVAAMAVPRIRVELGLITEKL